MWLSILIWILIGAIAGWLAGLLVRGFRFGLLGSIIIGLIGGVIGGWIFSVLGIFKPIGFWGDVLVSFIGAVVLLLVIRLFTRASP